MHPSLRKVISYCIYLFIVLCSLFSVDCGNGRFLQRDLDLQVINAWHYRSLSFKSINITEKKINTTSGLQIKSVLGTNNMSNIPVQKSLIENADIKSKSVIPPQKATKTFPIHPKILKIPRKPRPSWLLSHWSRAKNNSVKMKMAIVTNIRFTFDTVKIELWNFLALMHDTKYLRETMQSRPIYLPKQYSPPV